VGRIEIGCFDGLNGCITPARPQNPTFDPDVVCWVEAGGSRWKQVYPHSKSVWCVAKVTADDGTVCVSVLKHV
jgi:hypothetical protein